VILVALSIMGGAPGTWRRVKNNVLSKPGLVSLLCIAPEHSTFSDVWIKQTSVAVVKRRHMCMCGDCATELRKQTSKCPICRDNVDSMLEIKTASSKQNVDSAAAVTAAVNDLKLKD
jgi:hypothetical protein